MKYIEVILPLPVKGTFCYAVPEQYEHLLRPGIRVIVPFGARKQYTALVRYIHTLPPAYEGIREIICVLDDYPVLRHPQLKFWDWIADYYMAQVGEVYQAALPAGLKLESETCICRNEEFEAEVVLSSQEQKILDALPAGKTLNLDELCRITGFRNVMPFVKKLLEYGAVEVTESLADGYKPKMVRYVRLLPPYRTEQALGELFEQLGRAPKQLSLLMYFIELSKCLLPAHTVELSKKELLAKASSSETILRGLIDKGVMEIYQKEVSRLTVEDSGTAQELKLNHFQQKALESVQQSFLQNQVVLLHGVTSSGKTELYIKLIQQVIKEGKQVLYLVPEIALTTQLTTRLSRVFGSKLGVYHSRFSDSERVEVWNKMLQNEPYDLILGVRSSVFLPFRQLGLVIVDEEHEQSFKQQDPAPRYHARNAAIVLATMHGAKTLLGTATPSVESYFNATTGKYGFVELHERHEELELPEIRIVDMKDAYRKKRTTGHFSDVLTEHIAEALKRGEQVILFQNRRGYAPVLECKSCAYVPKCQHCDVSMTMHAAFRSLNCHYCGFTIPVPDRCPACGTPGLQTKGFGTEKIEDEIKQIFPEAKVLRMDLDTTRTKKAFQQIIAEVESGKADILIGTQMVAKGLDFGNVSLVGILNADNMLNYPDFRAHERAFQLMAQVSGRAGRKHKRGMVILQTFQPEHPVIQQVIKHDYSGMYQRQSDERKLFKYPPYFRIIQLTLKHRDADCVHQAVLKLTGELRKSLGARVLGPIVPAVSRIQNLYLRQIIIKYEFNASCAGVRQIIAQAVQSLTEQAPFKSVRVSTDVDPY
jgi:primosomal protein N' (replication factor Y)